MPPLPDLDCPDLKTFNNRTDIVDADQLAMAKNAAAEAVAGGNAAPSTNKRSAKPYEHQCT